MSVKVQYIKTLKGKMLDVNNNNKKNYNYLEYVNWSHQDIVL